MKEQCLLKELANRGYIYQNTNEKDLREVLQKKKISCYIGFDCTAQSLHVGSLMQIMLMRLMQKHGHRVIILLGSATTSIGDPSDKDGLRQIRSSQEIKENKESIAKIFSNFLDFQGDHGAIIVDNIEWLEKLSYLNFLRSYGRHFSINRMLTFDSVKTRLDRQYSLTFLEFNYMLLQAYDFLELYKKYDCILQFGGSEQWGNIVSGIDLIKKVENQNVFGITTPLITTSNGIKMGKTANGAVWLDKNMTSPYDFWQFWRNSSDEDVEKFLKIYTDLPADYLESIVQKNDINELKVLLANHITSLCHGEEEAKKAENTARITFSGGMGEELKTVTVDRSKLPLTLYQLLVFANLAVSNNEAKKLIVNRGVKVNNQTIIDIHYTFTSNQIDDNKDSNIKLSAGKKRHVIVNFISNS